MHTRDGTQGTCITISSVPLERYEAGHTVLPLARGCFAILMHRHLMPLLSSMLRPRGYAVHDPIQLANKNTVSATQSHNVRPSIFSSIVFALLLVGTTSSLACRSSEQEGPPICDLILHLSSYRTLSAYFSGRGEAVNYPCGTSASPSSFSGDVAAPPSRSSLPSSPVRMANVNHSPKNKNEHLRCMSWTDNEPYYLLL
jgi:hypothetical protein